MGSPKINSIIHFYGIHRFVCFENWSIAIAKLFAMCPLRLCGSLRQAEASTLFRKLVRKSYCIPCN
ncbi:hypothetical protein [Nostoc sp.]|uniref:hypothetical protein n=1 Tax=Nostoc sp. TaxID=1180 RepID=UPI002FF7360F